MKLAWNVRLNLQLYEICNRVHENIGRAFCYFRYTLSKSHSEVPNLPHTNQKYMLFIEKKEPKIRINMNVHDYNGEDSFFHCIGGHPSFSPCLIKFNQLKNSDELSIMNCLR
jgi:hypothetical protein